MPKFFEKYTFNRVDKDRSPMAVSSDGQRKLTPGTAYHAQNARLNAKEEGKIGSISSIKGNQVITNGNLPSGENTVVGSFEDIETNSIIFFVYNSLGAHSIHRFNGASGTFTKILEWSGLNFSGNPIKGIGKVGDNLYWTDGGNPRNIYLETVGYYSSTNEQQISLYKTPPVEILTVEFGTDITKTRNLICKDSFQFTYRFVYTDNSVSRLAPLTKSMLAVLNPDEFMGTSSRDPIQNCIDISYYIPSNLIQFIKKVQLYFVMNNDGNYYLFQENNASTFTAKFYNDYRGPLLAASETTTNESIPVESSCLAFFKDRLFLTNNEVGLDVSEGSISVSVEKSEEYIRDGLHFKGNGVYGFGIILSDTHGRTSLVKKAGDLQFKPNDPNNNVVSGRGDDYIREYAKLTISGIAPNWAKKYQLVMTKEKTFETYAQFRGYILFAQATKAEFDDLEYTPASSNYFTYAERYFSREQDGMPYSKMIHIMFPVGLAVTPESGMFIRTLHGNGFSTPLRINSIEGSRIVVEVNISDLETGDWSTTDFSNYFEIFSLKTPSEEIYYQIGESYSIADNKIIPSTEYLLEGDTHVVNINLDCVKEDSLDKLTNPSSTNAYPLAITKYNVESPTPTLKISNTPIEFNVHKDVLGTPHWDLNSEQLILDYTKSANHFGLPFALQKENGSDEQPNRLSFSNTYIQDSYINGLANFDSSNTRSIPNELSKITALIPVGGNIMLAVHERETSSISVGDGFIKTGDVDSILVKTEGVIGDDRQLLGSMGSVFPGSIQSHDGKVLFFDIYKGTVVRYTVAGLYPVSEYGMASYFKKLSDQYLPYVDQVNIVAGIDNFNTEYLITFPPVADLPGETWGFDYVNNSWTQYDFIPDYYAKIGNRLFTFKNGHLYEHHKTEAYNNFYGVQYERKITFFANPYVTMNKRLLNVHLNIDKLPSDPEYKVMVIRTPNGQESYLKVKHFEKKENKWYAKVLKDINTSVDSGKIALLDGADMRDNYFEIEVNSDISEQNLLNEVTLVMLDSQYSR